MLIERNQDFRALLMRGMNRQRKRRPVQLRDRNSSRGSASFCCAKLGACAYLTQSMLPPPTGRKTRWLSSRTFQSRTCLSPNRQSKLTRLVQRYGLYRKPTVDSTVQETNCTVALHGNTCPRWSSYLKNSAHTPTSVKRSPTVFSPCLFVYNSKTTMETH